MLYLMWSFCIGYLFEWYVARLVGKNMHQNDMCYKKIVDDAYKIQYYSRFTIGRAQEIEIVNPHLDILL